MANVNLNQESAKSQCDMIAAWLNNGNTITALEALKRFGCMRLASRICDLRDRGMNIVTETIKLASGKRVTEYRLSPDAFKK